MKSLDEYRKELEKDPAARRKLRKLEKEFNEATENLTEEELIKYGLKPASDQTDSEGDVKKDAAGAADSGSIKSVDSESRRIMDSKSKKAAGVIDLISKKI